MILEYDGKREEWVRWSVGRERIGRKAREQGILVKK